jgi:ketosteroid isomerase-like protein
MTQPTGGQLSKPRTFAETYTGIINKGDYAKLGDLFAEDALFLAPGAQRFEGRSAIAAFYTTFLSEVVPTVRICTYVESGDDCVFELEAMHNGSDTYGLGAIDHATVDAEGLVTRMAVYTK